MGQTEKHDYLRHLYTAIYMTEFFDREQNSGALFLQIKDRLWAIYVNPGSKQYFGGEDFPDNDDVGIDVSVQFHTGESYFQERFGFVLKYDLKTDVENFMRVVIETQHSWDKAYWVKESRDE